MQPAYAARREPTQLVSVEAGDLIRLQLVQANPSQRRTNVQPDLLAVPPQRRRPHGCRRNLVKVAVEPDRNLSNATIATLRLQAPANDEFALSDRPLQQEQQMGQLALRRARIGQLVVSESAAPIYRIHLDAAGWKLEDVFGVIRSDWKVAAAWLTDKSLEKKGDFSPQPWQEIAAVCDRIAYPVNARRLRWEAARKLTKRASWLSKLIQIPYGGLAGHGYYPLLAAAWLAGIILVRAGLVYLYADSFSPTANNKAAWNSAASTEQKGQLIAGAVGCDQLSPQTKASCFNPLFYAIDNSLPGNLTTGQAALWTPNSALGLSIALAVLKLFSWILVAFFLAGVTGLLRKT